ncbi:TIGR03545 family protein [Aeoliella sp. ICT_H6.2]|uniref:TIGR03545 family protein n=1 Tax=Aeoliella straminimaris TaxID=2954799 RepID=A0A9X2JF09_9BACT|nr:TIGR03545 family protein [Aeoliella straminimaris]MCO6042777.1 TIGR03545 family protein [Aeoliella straminimaris]
MRFFRFSYIVPRLVLVVLLLVATEIGSGYLLQWGIISGGESVVGAKVEVGRVKASLLETRVAIRDLAVANPRSPMNNLVVAERIEIDFDSTALLRKKLIADYGVISGLDFGTQREISGALPEAPPMADDSSSPGWVKPMATQYAEAWLADLEGRFSTDVHQQLESVRLAEELAERWPQKYKDLQSKAKAIKAQAKQLEQDVRTAKTNPLRHAEFLTQVPQRVGELQRSLKSLQGEVKALPDQLKADQARIAQARKHDEQLIREKLKLGDIDGKELSNYLLGEKITAPAGEVISWVRWARQFVPPRNQKVVQAPADRGQNIQFAGCQQLPDMLVKAVRLDGSARLGGQPVELVGVVRDWTNQPSLHKKPTTLELTTKGGLPLTIQATFDRSQLACRDEIQCTASDLLLPKTALGREGKLQLAVAPTRADVVLTLHLVDDKLEGKLELTQGALNIKPTVAAGALGERLETALTASIGRIEKASTTVDITGTLDHPQFDLHSTLGEHLATAISQAAKDVVASERQRLLALGQQEMDAQLAKLDNEFAAFQSKVATELKGPGEILALLTGQRGNDPQIGQSPFGQLFK